MLKRSEVRAFTRERVLCKVRGLEGFRAAGQTFLCDDLGNMVRQSGKMFWATMNERELLRANRFWKETVLVTVQGTGVAFKGQRNWLR